MFSVDLNCDMGESLPGKPIGDDEGIMPFISSANIACGFHGGGSEIMKKTILLARQYGVAVGAHPSFDDIEGFGRRDIELRSEDIYALISVQVHSIRSMAETCGVRLHHVKPHGALYNMAAKRLEYARAIAAAISDIDHELLVYGLAGSALIRAADEEGLRSCSEVFADRTYISDGSLSPRSMTGAVIENQDESVDQVLNMLKRGEVQSITGEWIKIKADTICLHGDHAGAALFAKALRKAIEAEGIMIQSCFT